MLLYLAAWYGVAMGSYKLDSIQDRINLCVSVGDSLRFILGFLGVGANWRSLEKGECNLSGILGCFRSVWYSRVPAYDWRKHAHLAADDSA